MQRGSNSIGVRRYNERLALATIRRLGGAAKADIARLTGLSPQAAVRIVESLEDEGKLVRAGRRKGGLGQPATIYKINGGSGCTVGVEVGRDQLICVLLSFEGVVLSRLERYYNFPQPEAVMTAVAEFVSMHLAQLPTQQREGFLGTGIAMPWFIGEWREELAIGRDAAEEWNGAMLEERFRARLDGPIFFENDGNAGALAELFGGAGLNLKNFLYVHIGKFVGGGLVLGGELHEGRHGNAAAIASMPIPRDGTIDMLLHRASLYPFKLDLDWDRDNPELDEWLNGCADALGFVAIGANSLLDLDALIFGGRLPPPVLATLIGRIAERIDRQAPRDFFQPALLTGHYRELAPALGAGLLPLFSTFSPNLDSLMKGHGSNNGIPESA